MATPFSRLHQFSESHLWHTLNQQPWELFPRYAHITPCSSQLAYTFLKTGQKSRAQSQSPEIGMQIQKARSKLETLAERLPNPLRLFRRA
ncbi:hypothetical protein [Ferrovibrio sp.]|uniref:hypothetical protein n=1 Tax=Ferrovibrio sp. TaxID=1917215 RepID=UPI003D28286F